MYMNSTVSTLFKIQKPRTAIILTKKVYTRKSSNIDTQLYVLKQHFSFSVETNDYLTTVSTQ